MEGAMVVVQDLRRGSIVWLVAGVAIAVTMAIAGTPAGAQDATAEVVVENGAGEQVGTATVTEADGFITITLIVDGLPPGVYAVHLHNPGVCESEDGTVFTSTGGPSDPLHGPTQNDLGTPTGTIPIVGVVVPQAGDLGNITVVGNGTTTLNISTNQVSAQLGPDATLADADGSALAIHALEDGQSVPPSNAPSGASEPHIACGVIFPPAASATPAATEAGG
jgi:superoxide dismutase, Cu-Zn family